jgi:anti-sigma B factor antagonist
VLSVVSNRDGDRVTVRAHGEIDLADLNVLAAELSSAAEGDAHRIEVDLAGVSFMDSMGIHALLTGRRLAQERGKQYRVIGVDGNVRHILEAAGVWTHLTGKPQ